MRAHATVVIALPARRPPAALRQRIRQVHSRTTGGTARTVLLGVVLLDAGAEAIPAGRCDADPSPVQLALIARLTGNFRTDDRLSMRAGGGLLLVCSIGEQADAGVLADRFRSLLQDWATATDPDHERPITVRIAVGRCRETDTALLSRLDGDSCAAASPPAGRFSAGGS